MGVDKIKKIFCKLLFILVSILILFEFNSNVLCYFDKNNPNIIQLNGAKNVRELGGYSTNSGEKTLSKSFLRADSLDELTNDDIKILLEYGVKNILDLRSEKDVNRKPDVEGLVKNTNYVCIEVPIKTEILREVNIGREKMSDFYIEILGEKQSVRQIFEFIETHIEGVTLFHCTHGKDRTGVISLILLGLAGVKEDDLVQDYSISYELIKDKPVVKKGIMNKGLPGYLSESEYIIGVLEYIKTTYGNFENYLLSCGIELHTIESVKNKLVKK